MAFAKLCYFWVYNFLGFKFCHFWVIFRIRTVSFQNKKWAFLLNFHEFWCKCTLEFLLKHFFSKVHPTFRFLNFGIFIFSNPKIFLEYNFFFGNIFRFSKTRSESQNFRKPASGPIKIMNWQVMTERRSRSCDPWQSL